MNNKSVENHLLYVKMEYHDYNRIPDHIRINNYIKPKQIDMSKWKEGTPEEVVATIGDIVNNRRWIEV